MTIGSNTFTSHTSFEHEIKANGLKNNDGRNNFHDGKLLVKINFSILIFNSISNRILKFFRKRIVT